MSARTTSIYQEQIESVTRALRVSVPDRHRWFGAWSPAPPRDALQRIDQETRRRLLLSQVQFRLYQQFYQHGTAVPADHDLNIVAVAEERDFVRSLSEANRGRGSWQGDWTVVERTTTGTWARHDGLTVFVPPEHSRSIREASEPASETIAVLMPKEFLKQLPGFYLAQSDEPFRPSPTDILTRLYWNISAIGAKSLIGSVTSRLNAECIPFQIKVLNNPRLYVRNDAGVLYIAKRELPRASHLLEQVYQDVGRELHPGTPALTKRLAPGLALAEDPQNGESFGLHRCRLLAEALVDAAEHGVTGPSDRLDWVEREFQRSGLDLSRPYLNPGTADDYDEILHLNPTQPATANGNRPPEQPSGEFGTVADDPEQTETYRQIARMIGDRLANHAIWHDGRCTWLGPRMSLSDGHALDRQPVYGVIGPDVYSGTAGIALFLAQLYAETGEDEYRTVARGAIDCSIAKVEELFEQGHIGFYTGWPGVIASVARVGRLVDDGVLARDVPSQLIDRFSGEPETPQVDLLSGAAGATLAFLSLWRLLDDERCLENAIAFGDLLLSNAKRRGSAAWWPVQTPSGKRAMTGFAHGAAGIAFALLDLFMATQDERYQQAAEGAFRFEHRHFHPKRQNWLDLRYPVEGSRFGPGAFTASVWCHGSGGISISRLAAWKILGDSVYLDEACTGIEATSTWLEQNLSMSEKPWSFCHGLPGNADILLWAAESLPRQKPSLKRLVRSVAGEGQAVASDGEGTADFFGMDEPGLFLGHAGIGYFYLRLSNTDIPSLLVPSSMAFELVAGS